MLLGILARRNTEMFLEHGREVCLIAETYGISHLGHVDSSFTYEPCGLFQSQVTYKLSRGDAGNLFHLAMQVGTADSDFLDKLLHVEIRIAQILVQAFHDTFHELVIVAL